MANSISNSLDRAARVAADRGVSLTETRRRVFELVLKAGQPVGAYRLMEAMRNPGGRVMPPTVYRALNFLLDNGLVHRIESLNAFIACAGVDHDHEGQFLICSDCGRTARSWPTRRDFIRTCCANAPETRGEFASDASGRSSCVAIV